MSTAADASLRAVIEGFRERLAAAGAADSPRLHETHISIVLLAGDYAYKFKKAVDFGFLDFSSLDKRRLYCERELVLNRRFAPSVYLGVEPVLAPDAAPGAPPVEYAVKMRRFADGATLDTLVAAGWSDPELLAHLARELAEVHAAQGPAPPKYAGRQAVARQVEQSMAAPLAPFIDEVLKDAVTAALAHSAHALDGRRRDGKIRDCHGDLHLGNLVLYEGSLLAFDCIEFNDSLRLIDTFSDVAFLVMDLDFHGAAALASGFLNAYLTHTGDYGGLAVLRLYLTYRTLVRARVAMLGAAPENALRARQRAQAHVAQAGRYLRPVGRVGLVITHGLSGSGKTHHARALADKLGFVHIRSDVERKRLAGLQASERSASPLGARLYDPASTRATYERLATLAGAALAAGFSAVVDATFLREADRQTFKALAQQHGAAFHVLHCEAPTAELARRIEQRLDRGDDASEATPTVLAWQQEAVEPLTDAERAVRITPQSLTAAPATLAQGLGRARPT